MMRLNKLAQGLIVCGVLAGGSAPASAFQFDEPDFLDCEAAEGQFEMLICASPGAYDLLNHLHQSIYFAEQDGAEEISDRVQAWIVSLEAACMQRNIRRAHDCLYEQASESQQAQAFAAEIELLRADESDIEGDEECDGCEGEMAEAEEPVVSAPSGKPAPGPLSGRGKSIPVNSSQIGPDFSTVLMTKAAIHSCSQLNYPPRDSYDEEWQQISDASAEIGFDPLLIKIGDPTYGSLVLTLAALPYMATGADPAERQQFETFCDGMAQAFIIGFDSAMEELAQYAER